jgi:hypothetical protein
MSTDVRDYLRLGDTYSDVFSHVRSGARPLALLQNSLQKFMLYYDI